MKKLLIALAIGLSAVAAQADDLTAEEQALVDKGATMEMFAPNEHSRHYITHLEATSHNGKVQKTENPEPVLCFVFGMEDAAPARAEGQGMAEFKYSPTEAQQFLFAQGWDKYHDRFFTRAYVQEGLEAFNAARKRK
jgi:hypothetical protein